MSISSRLNELGITLPTVAAPVASYVPAVRAGNLIFTSGQLPFADGALSATGKVGADISPDDATAAAQQAALNALAAAAAEAGGVDNLSRVVKVTVFVAAGPGFTGQPAVANGASEVLGAIFGSGHARSAVSCPALPMDSPVEVEIVVEVAG